MTIRDAVTRAAKRAVEGEVFAMGLEIVSEVFRGLTVWEGPVFTFKDKRNRIIYAWAIQNEKEPQYVTVAGGGKIDSPVAAVRAWIVSQATK